ncbi:hypothetical protein ACVW1B_005212 [Bradyrhizobium sp. USDA 4502]
MAARTIAQFREQATALGVKAAGVYAGRVGGVTP